MQLLLSRILKYFNGCLDYDHMYRISSFIIKYYNQIFDMSLDEFLEKGNFTNAEVEDFYQHLGFHSYNDFVDKLYMDYQLRNDQIQSRMMMVEDYNYIDYIESSLSQEELKSLVDELCTLIFGKKRIVIIGALYPCSVSVDFQTDLITLGKNVVQYHQFDPDFRFDEDDLVIMISATGRIMKAYSKSLKPCGICNSDILLMTQNVKYANYDNMCADYTMHVKGKYDGMQFNYQIMMLFDILRIHYYKKYYN